MIEGNQNAWMVVASMINRRKFPSHGDTILLLG